MMVDEMIRKAAGEAANEWLAEQQPKIKKMVADNLANKSKGLIASIADQLSARMARGFEATVWLKGKE